MRVCRREQIGDTLYCKTSSLMRELSLSHLGSQVRLIEEEEEEEDERRDASHNREMITINYHKSQTLFINYFFRLLMVAEIFRK